MLLGRGPRDEWEGGDLGIREGPPGISLGRELALRRDAEEKREVAYW